MPAIGIAQDMNLTVKHTFIDYEKPDQGDGPTSTDSAVTEGVADDSTDADKDSTEVDADGAVVNESATEELKAFLGLGLQDELPISPPSKLPTAKSPKEGSASPSRRPEDTWSLKEAKTPSAQHNETAHDTDSAWSQPSQDVSKSFSALNAENHKAWLMEGPDYRSSQQQHKENLPTTGMQPFTWWSPDTYGQKQVLNMNNLIILPNDNRLNHDNYMQPQQQPVQWQFIPYNTATYFQESSASATTAGESEEHNTTVILRNVPNNYTRKMLLDLLDVEGFAFKCDLVYIPIDFCSQAGLGYAFVNLVSPQVARQFWAHFDGFRGWSVPSEKVCSLNWSRPIQGLDAHVERYRNSPVMHDSVPDEWKPAIFINGKRVAFPAPTKTIKAPKIRNGH